MSGIIKVINIVKYIVFKYQNQIEEEFIHSVESFHTCTFFKNTNTSFVITI